MKKLALVLFGAGLIGSLACSSSDSGSANDGGGGAGGASSDGAATDGATGGTGGADAAASDAAAKDGATTTDGPAGDTAAPVSVMVTKAAGGTVTLGNANMAIPADALAGDATLTVSAAAPDDSLPNKDLIKGMVYDFGPNGTQFLKPVDLTLPVVGTVPADSEAVVSWYDTNAGNWIDLTTTVSGSNVQAKVTHFTRFVVRFLVKGVACASEPPCGGSIDGTWEFIDICVGSSKPISNTACGNDASGVSTQSSAASGSGTVIIGAGKYSLDLTLTLIQDVTYSGACLSAFESSKKVATCAELEAKIKGDKTNLTVTCTGTVATSCHCVGKTANPAIKEMGTVTTSGMTATFVKEGSTSGGADPYCSKNGKLQVRSTKDGIVYTLKKKT